MTGTRVEDHFKCGQEYEDLLDEANANASDKQETFVEDMLRNWRQYGMRAFLSEGQLRYLHQIADPEDEDFH